jgi:hypothetical protein
VLQRLRCKDKQRNYEHFCKKIIVFDFENALAYYNAGVVAANLKVVVSARTSYAIKCQ